MKCSPVFTAISCLALAFCFLAWTPSPVAAQPSFFENVTVQLGVDTTDYAGDAVWYDWEGDGDLDLLLACRYGSGAYIYQNDGGQFTALTGIGLPDNIDGGRPIPMDFNHDGTLDLFFLCYSNPSPMFVNENGHFVEHTADLGLPQVMHDRENKWIDVNHDGWMDLLLGNAEEGFKLFRNDGGTHFTDITVQSNLPALTDFMQIAECDYDLDGDIDLFMTRLNHDDHLFQNDGNGVFADVTAAAGLSGAYGNGGCKWVNFDKDKYPDLLTQGPGRHAIWRNNGDGTLSEMNVHGTETDFDNTGFPNTATYAVADFDMDGDDDLYVCRPGGCGLGSAPNQFFIQDSLRGHDIWFHDVAPQWGMDFEEDGAPGVGDYDSDGDLDLYITRSQAPFRLFRNTINDHNRLEVRALGPNGELDRWHTRVEVYNHGTNDVVATSELNTSWVGQNGLSNYFVLNENGHYDLRIYFLSGTVMTPEEYPQLSDVVPSEIDHKLTIIQGQGVLGAQPKVNPSASDFRLEAVYPNPFNSQAMIRYNVPVGGYARIDVFDVLGRHIRDLVNESVGAGEHSVRWDAGAVASGVYFVRLEAGGQVAQQKALLLK